MTRLSQQPHSATHSHGNHSQSKQTPGCCWLQDKHEFVAQFNSDQTIAALQEIRCFHLCTRVPQHPVPNRSSTSMAPWYGSYMNKPIRIPLDGIVLSIPVAAGCLYLVGLVAKTLTMDPEMSTAKYYEKEEPELEKECTRWNDSWKSVFDDRIKKTRFGVFNNRFGDSPQ